MTLDEVREARDALAREGKLASYNAVLARLGHGSKRDVQRFMQQLGGLESAAVAVEEPEVACAESAQAIETPQTTAVAVEEPPEPALPPRPAPPRAPLHLARTRRDQTALAEQALGLKEQALKRQRQALDTRHQQLDIQQVTVPTDAADLARRRGLREVLTALETVEAERRALHRGRQAAAAAMVEAADQYEALAGQAARWLRRLRHAQRTAATSAVACERGDAGEAMAQALAQLAALVGQAEAQRCAEACTIASDIEPMPRRPAA